MIEILRDEMKEDGRVVEIFVDNHHDVEDAIAQFGGTDEEIDGTDVITPQLVASVYCKDGTTLQFYAKDTATARQIWDDLF